MKHLSCNIFNHMMKLFPGVKEEYQYNFKDNTGLRNNKKWKLNPIIPLKVALSISSYNLSFYYVTKQMIYNTKDQTRRHQFICHVYVIPKLT